MITGADILWSGIVPGLAAAVTLAAMWQLTQKAASAWRTGLVLGYVIGHWAIDARTIGVVAALSKAWQPTEARDWLPLFALLAILPDAVACLGKRGPVVGWILRVGFCVFLPWRIVYGSAHWPLSLPGVDFDFGGWSTAEATYWIGGITATFLAAWQLMRMVDQAQNAWLRSVLAGIVALGSAITVAMSAYLTGGLMLASLTAALAGCGLAAAMFSTGRGPEAAAGPLVVLFGSLLLIAHFFAELKLHHGVLLLVSMTLAVGWLPLPSKLPPRWQALGRSLVCLITLAVPLTLAGLKLANDAPPPVETNPYQNFQP